ncbi:MAG: asparagine synthase-related protein, partial [Gemmatimonadota bacterium]|nr:asparagine synthase-related protein [Gemmatimonadota bacterium]
LATTTFLDIQRIPPGHALSMRAGDGSPRVWRHSELPSPSLARHRTDRDVVEHFRSVFREAVSDRLTEPAAGVFMSGGIDSPGLAAMAKRVLEDRGAAYDLRAVTVVWDEAIPDEERRYAGLVAERLGMPIEYVVADAFEPFEGWGTEPLGRPEPYDEPELQSWVAECRAMTRHARVGLYGEDPDTLLMPVPLRGELRRDRPLALAGRVARYVKANGRLPYMGTGLAARFRSPPSAPQSPADATEYPTWLDSKFERSVGGRERYDDWWAEPKLNGSAHAEPHRMLSSPLWQSFLESLDSGVTGFPLEIRLPYMDVRVVEFLLSLPTVPWRQKKHLLRASLEGWLPTEVLERPKAPLNGAFEARLLHWKTHAPPLDGVERDLLDAYVDVFALERRLSSGEQTAWTDLRPIALGHWLTQVAG